MCALRFNHCFLFLFLFFIIRVVYIVMYIYNVYTFFPYIYIFFMYIYIIHTSFSLLYYLRYCISSAFKSKYSLVYHYTVPHTFPLSLLSTSAREGRRLHSSLAVITHTATTIYYTLRLCISFVSVWHFITLYAFFCIIISSNTRTTS